MQKIFEKTVFKRMKLDGLTTYQYIYIFYFYSPRPGRSLKSRRSFRRAADGGASLLDRRKGFINIACAVQKNFKANNNLAMKNVLTFEPASFLYVATKEDRTCITHRA
jgi:hypothetical protein